MSKKAARKNGRILSSKAGGTGSAKAHESRHSLYDNAAAWDERARLSGMFSNGNIAEHL